MSDLTISKGFEEDMQIKEGYKMVHSPNLGQTKQGETGGKQTNGHLVANGSQGDRGKTMENLTSRRENTSENCYVKVLKRIVYLSLVIWSAGFRKIFEAVTGIKLPKIKIDHKMIARGQARSPDWVRSPFPFFENYRFSFLSISRDAIFLRTLNIYSSS